VSVYRSAADIKILTENDQLTGEDVLPGFTCRVGDIFTSP
jgi:Uma2 family endonuclease